MKNLTLTSLFLATASLTFSHPSQAQHVSGGNGGLDPKTAYSDAGLNGVGSNFNLDYLKLTPDDIRNRDEALKPIYQFYQEVTVSKVIQKLEDIYGLSIFEYSNLHPLTLKDKKNVMASAIFYFTKVVSGEWSSTDIFDSNGILSQGTPFEHIDSDILPGKASVNLKVSQVHYVKITGGKEFETQFDRPWPFAISTIADANSSEHDWLGLGIVDFNTHSHALYSSTTIRLFELPVMDRFLSAMKDSNLKALDATIVFGNLENQNLESEPYQVIYPEYSALAPIPQPIVYVNTKASKEDLADLLQTQAPQIYAYNQLFMKQILPSADDLDQALKQYPALMASVAQAKKEVDRARLKDALKNAFLYVSYGIMTGAVAGVAAPVALVAALASPILAPLIISNTIVVIQ
jgi:hypothetical protein